PSEREFEQFLQGKHPLDQQLHAERRDAEPPPELDIAILHKAQTAVRPQARPFKRIGAQWALWSTAASLLLAGILLFHAPSPVIERGSEPVSQSAPPALRSGTPSQQETFADERLDTAKAAPQAYSQAMEQTVNTRRKAEATQE